MTNHDDHDEISGIFDDITMADFIRETSATAEVARENRGAEAFNAFVEEQLRAIRTAWIASETYVQPVAILANAEKQRVFIPDDDESMGQYIARLNREARAMEATWTFIIKRAMVADYGLTDAASLTSVDINDAEKWQEAEARGLARLGVTWYAERREGRSRQVRHGQMQDDNGVLGELIEGSARQPHSLFAGILAR